MNDVHDHVPGEPAPGAGRGPSPSPTRTPGLARRVAPALVLTGASGVLLGVLDRPTTAADITAAAGPPSTLTSGTPATTVGGSSTVASTVPTAPAITEAPTTAASAEPTTTPAAAVPETTATAAVAVPETTVPATTGAVEAIAGSCSGQPYTGPLMTTRWGPVQVAATVAADGTICDVSALVSPSGHHESVEINQAALPLLHDWVMFVNGADFQSITGATITSDAYKLSLQAILDAL